MKEYNYSVLRFIPNDFRGEVVNVGIVVFRDNGYDLRLLSNHSKLRALVEGVEDDLLPGVRSEVEFRLEPEMSAEEMHSRIKKLHYFHCSELSTFYADTHTEYRATIRELMKQWVEPLKELPHKAEDQAQIFHQLGRRFGELNILSSERDQLTPGLIYSRYPVDGQNRIFSEYLFEAKTRTCLIETINFNQNIDVFKRNVAYKTMVIDFAHQRFGQNIETYLAFKGDNLCNSALAKIILEKADHVVDVGSQEKLEQFVNTVAIEAHPNQQLTFH